MAPGGQATLLGNDRWPTNQHLIWICFDLDFYLLVILEGFSLCPHSYFQEYGWTWKERVASTDRRVLLGLASEAQLQQQAGERGYSAKSASVLVQAEEHGRLCERQKLSRPIIFILHGNRGWLWARQSAAIDGVY